MEGLHRIMLNAKEAVDQAQLKAAEMLTERPFRLEEIEKDVYKGRDVWDITLSYAPSAGENSAPTLASLARGNLQYKRILIDAKTGELGAMKLHEVSAR